MLSWRRSSCSRSRICSGQWACCSRLHSVRVCVRVRVCARVVRTWIHSITALYGTHTISANEWVWMNKRELFPYWLNPKWSPPSPPQNYRHISPSSSFSPPSLPPVPSPSPHPAKSALHHTPDASVCVRVRERECERAALRRDVSVWREKERERGRGGEDRAIGERACGGWVCDEREMGGALGRRDGRERRNRKPRKDAKKSKINSKVSRSRSDTSLCVCLSSSVLFRLCKSVCVFVALHSISVCMWIYSRVTSLWMCESVWPQAHQ